MFESNKYDYVRDLDPINFKEAIDRIKMIVNIKMKNQYLISDKFTVFEFKNEEKCPLTGYFINTLFNGPIDDHDYYKKNNMLNAYDEIKNVISTYGKFILEVNNSPNGFIYYVKNK